MGKCRGAAMEATQAVGVQTRSRAAAVAKVVVSKRWRPLPPSPLRAAAAASLGLGGDSRSCYLKLRSRMLFIAPPPSTPLPAQGAALAAGLSRCSSTASSSSAAQDRTMPCRSDVAVLPGELSDVESDLAAGQNGSRSLPSATEVQAAASAVEVKEFFAAAEEADARRFASKYNFDVARGVPLNSDRFEWAPAVEASACK